MSTEGQVDNKIGLEGAEKVKIRRRLVKADSWPKFYRGLAMLFSSGITLDNAIAQLYRSTEDIGLRRALRKTGKALSRGTDLPRAFRESVPNFAPFHQELIYLGMETGKLAVILDHLADYEEKKQKMNLKLRATLTYPAFQTGLAFLILLIAPAHFQASLMETLSSLNEDTPVLLSILFKVSWVANYFVLGCLCVLVILPLVWDPLGAVLAHERTIVFYGRVRDKALRIADFIPGLGRIFQAFAQERFTRALALQLDAGRPLLPSLRSAFRATASPVFKDWEDKVVEDVQNGESLEESLRSTGLFDEISFLSFMKVGEESGVSAEILNKSANLQAESIDANLSSAMAALEPVLLCLVGLFIGGIILTFFVPLTQMIQTL